MWEAVGIVPLFGLPSRRGEEEVAVVLTPIPLGLPRHPTGEIGAPLGTPLQVVLAAEGEP